MTNDDDEAKEGKGRKEGRKERRKERSCTNRIMCAFCFLFAIVSSRYVTLRYVLAIMIMFAVCFDDVDACMHTTLPRFLLV